MPSYRTSARSRLLTTLRDRRLDGERQAERDLVRALAALGAAEAEAARLGEELDRARRAYSDGREAAVPAVPERAAEAQARRLFRGLVRDRLEAARQSASEALKAHRAGALADAVRGAEAARAAHLSARRRREVVERAIERRTTTEAREQSRRAEAELDDRAPPRRG